MYQCLNERGTLIGLERKQLRDALIFGYGQDTS
jgi:hypothetical protein